MTLMRTRSLVRRISTKIDLDFGLTCRVGRPSLWSRRGIWQGNALRGNCRSTGRQIGRSSDRAADDARRRRHGQGQSDHSVAHGIRGDDDPRSRQSPHRLGRQTDASDPDLGDRRPLRLFRRRPYQARRRGRIHAYRDPSPRRRRRRERPAPRQGGRAGALGQRGERPGRRFSPGPSLQDDGRGRLAPLSRGACPAPPW